MSDDSDGLIGEFTHRQGLILALIVAVPFVLLIFLDRESFAQPTLIALTAIGSTIWIFRRAWRRAWFWMAMLAIGVAHFLVLRAFHWPLETGTRIAPYLALDVVLTFAIIAIAARLFEGRWP